MSRRVPDRWENYTPVGDRVAGTRFICFKVPLHQGLSSLVPEPDRMTPCDLVARIKSMGYKLGLMVDLTNTSRYYNYKEIEDLGMGYHKIHTEGHVVPSKAVRKNFFSTVDEFLRNNVDNDLLVGVHCTHGVNRTGYLVCKYMVTRLNFPAKEAIAAFNMARGHPLERSNYIADLWNSTPSNNGIADGDAKTTPDATSPRSRDRAPRRHRNDYQHWPYDDTRERDEEKPWKRGHQTPYWRDNHHRGAPADPSSQYQMPWQPVDYPQWNPAPWQIPANWYPGGGGQNFVNRPGGASNEQTDYGAPYYGHPTYYGAGYGSQ